MAKLVNSNGLERFKGHIEKEIAAGDAVSADISVELGAGGTLGGYKTGDTISKNTPIETVIKKLLAKQIPPTYTAPSVSIANNGGSASGAYEYGSIVTPKIKATFNKNDAGDLTAISIKKGSAVVEEGTVSPLTHEEDAITLTATVSFSASVSYSEGAVKNDNLGDPYATGHIAAGSKSSSNFSYTVYRQGYFWGILDTSSADEALTSDIIRNGTKKNGAYASGSIGSATSPVIKAADVTGRKRIFVACPATNKGVTKVTMPSAMNADCTADFVKQSSTITVEGANGATGIAYNVWVYEPAAISDDQTFVVNLG